MPGFNAVRGQEIVDAGALCKKVVTRVDNKFINVPKYKERVFETGRDGYTLNHQRRPSSLLFNHD